MLNNVIEKSFRCDCMGGEHYISFYAFAKTAEEEPIIYVDLMSHERGSLWRRLKEAWKIIRKKPACYDGIILEERKSRELVEFLKIFWNIK